VPVTAQRLKDESGAEHTRWPEISQWKAGQTSVSTTDKAP